MPPTASVDVEAPLQQGVRTRRLGTDDSSQLLATLARDCHPLQFLRELTQNAAEAGASTVLWDVDWERWMASKGRDKKLTCVDDGTGMDSDALDWFLGNLAASDAEKKLAGRNFGMGLKVACMHANTAGTEVASWRDGQAAQATLVRTRPVPVAYDVIGPQAPAFKAPVLIEDAGHGTKVTLLGHRRAENTATVPKSVTEGKPRWIRRALNTRYFVPPAGVAIRVREDFKLDWKAPRAGVFAEVRGQKHYLDGRAVASGVVELNESRAHWWLLDEDQAGRKREGDVWASSGHVAALYRDELYDLRAPSHGGYRRLAEFGVRLGQDRVVIYVEPMLREPVDRHGERVSPTAVRTTLQIDSTDLPWEKWAAAFQEQMPDELAELQERLGSRSGAGDHKAWIVAQLGRVSHLYRASRNRVPLAAGGARLRPADPERTDGAAELLPAALNELTAAGSPPAAGPSETPVSVSPDASAAGTPGGRADASRAEALERGDDADEDDGEDQLAAFAELVPDIRWVSAVDGTRAAGDFEDRAASYDRERNELLINADFWAYRDMLRDFGRQPRYQRAPNAEQVIRDTVQAYISAQLVEAVLTAHAHRRREHWSDEDLEMLLSPVGLSGALTPRSLLWAAVNNRLALLLG